MFSGLRFSFLLISLSCFLPLLLLFSFLLVSLSWLLPLLLFLLQKCDIFNIWDVDFINNRIDKQIVFLIIKLFLSTNNSRNLFFLLKIIIYHIQFYSFWKKSSLNSKTLFGYFFSFIIGNFISNTLFVFVFANFLLLINFKRIFSEINEQKFYWADLIHVIFVYLLRNFLTKYFILVIKD